MSRSTDEHQNPIEVEDEQTPVETETLDDDNYDDENKPIKKSVLPIKTIATVGVLAALIGGIRSTINFHHVFHRHSFHPFNASHRRCWFELVADDRDPTD